MECVGCSHSTRLHARICITLCRLIVSDMCGILQVLLSCAHDLDIDATDEEGLAPLHLLVKAAEVEGIKVGSVGCELAPHLSHVVLLASTCSMPAFTPDSPTLHCPTMLQLLLDAKADINVKGPGGDTPLHTAVQYDDIDIVELLLEQ